MCVDILLEYSQWCYCGCCIAKGSGWPAGRPIVLFVVEYYYVLQLTIPNSESESVRISNTYMHVTVV